MTSVKNVNVQLRIIIYFLLIKILAQTNNKKDIHNYLIKLEELCNTYKKQSYNHYDSLIYLSYLMKFKLEYEEWNITNHTNQVLLYTTITTKLLPDAMQYLEFTLKINEIQIIR
jgi:hypothetical protein